MIVVSFVAANVVAATPLNITAVTPVKPVPVTVTVVPTGPEVGVKDVIVGAGAGTPWQPGVVPQP